jgi:hypothetical protein
MSKFAPDAPYNGTIRRWVKEGLRKPCEPNKCIVGLIGTHEIPMDEWQANVDAWQRSIGSFNESRQAIPHPGFAFPIRFCTKCGNPVMEFHGETPEDIAATEERIANIFNAMTTKS